MNETRVHVVITDLWKRERPQASSVVNVPPGAGLARFRAAALSECCRFVNRPARSPVCGKQWLPRPDRMGEGQASGARSWEASWSHRSRDGGTESSSSRVNWGTSASRKAHGIIKKPGGEWQKLGCGHSKPRGWRTEQPLAEPRATGRVCRVRDCECRRAQARLRTTTLTGEISTVAAYKWCEPRRSLLTARLKPYWGKPAVRNFRGGGGNESMVWWLFATKPERVDTTEAADLHRSRLHSTRPIHFQNFHL